jgi:hypothetical protein
MMARLNQLRHQNAQGDSRGKRMNNKLEIFQTETSIIFSFVFEPVFLPENCIATSPKETLTFQIEQKGNSYVSEVLYSDLVTSESQIFDFTISGEVIRDDKQTREEKLQFCSFKKVQYETLNCLHFGGHSFYPYMTPKNNFLIRVLNIAENSELLKVHTKVSIVDLSVKQNSIKIRANVNAYSNKISTSTILLKPRNSKEVICIDIETKLDNHGLL